MDVATELKDRLTLPVMASPMFIISQPDLVIAQCKSGIIGSFPAPNARPKELLDEWLARITEELSNYQVSRPGQPAGPFAVNQVVHKTNNRIDHDLALCVKYRVPIIITSLGLRDDLIDAVHGYGGLVFHDVTTVAHARKAAERGVDGLIAVAGGAGGHAGVLSPFALVQEVRQWWQGPLALAGAIASGRSILAAQVMGADLAYIGSAFIATEEAHADEAYKQMVVDCAAADIIYTNQFSGVHGNYLKPSIRRHGLDPDRLAGDPKQMNFGEGIETMAKAWKDIWGCGQGIGAVDKLLPAAALIDRWKQEYREARGRFLS